MSQWPDPRIHLEIGMRRAQLIVGCSALCGILVLLVRSWPTW